MTRKVMSAGVMVLVVCILIAANPKPNFSGAWTMDRERSFGQPANIQQTMTVTQTEDRITVETKLILPDSERIVKDTYVLDGKEYEFTPPLPLNAPANTPAAKGKRTANWLPNAVGILVTEVITNETPKGPTTTQIMRKWTITSNGELTITMFIDSPTVSYETKRVFLRKWKTSLSSEVIHSHLPVVAHKQTTCGDCRIVPRLALESCKASDL